MPLRAIADGIELIAVDLNKKQWADLGNAIKSGQTVIKLPCCNSIGYLRTSSTGLQHFVHKKSDILCDWKPESEAHLQAKLEIVKACDKAGWRAIPEFSESTWRADVLAVKGNKRIAFEVQLSKQSFIETANRQEKYRESNVRACWFFESAPKELLIRKAVLKADKNIPAFAISFTNEGGATIDFNQESIPVHDFVLFLLEGRIRYCDSLRIRHKQFVTIVFFEAKCWKCRRIHTFWSLEPYVKSMCNKSIFLENCFVMYEDLKGNPSVINAIEWYLKTSGRELNQYESSTPISSEERISSLSKNSCVYCQAVTGYDLINKIAIGAAANPNRIRYKVEVEINPWEIKEGHWCYSANNEFCE